MKAYNNNIEFTCTCANQSLLTPGCTCETCMGIVPEPVTAQPAAPQYSADYFEALEQMQVEIGLAA